MGAWRWFCSTELSARGGFCWLTVVLSTLALWSTLAPGADAQSLADPAREYVRGNIGGRDIYWCPSGYGYLAFCPQPSNYDSYTWCCVWPYERNSWRPACCQFAIPTGAVVCVILGAIILFCLLVAISCWCCVCCPLYKHLYYDEEPHQPPHQPDKGRR